MSKRALPESLTDQVTDQAPARRVARCVGKDEARVMFLEAVGECAPLVFKELAGEVLPRLEENDQALQDALTEWQRRSNLTAPWCREKALELLDEWAAGGAPAGKVDLLRDISPPGLLRLVLQAHYVATVKAGEGAPDGGERKPVLRTSMAAARRRMLAEADEQITAFLKAARGREVLEVRNPEYFAWAARWQCGGDLYGKIAESVSLEGDHDNRVTTVKRVVWTILEFIELERRPRGGHRLTHF